MTDHFSVASRRYGPVVYLAPEGALDVDTAPVLEGSVETLIEDRPWVLVVDLGRVDFIDSSGLRALLTCKDDAEHTGGCFQVREVKAFQRRLLEITGLDKVLDLVDDDCSDPVDRRDTSRSPVQANLADA